MQRHQEKVDPLDETKPAAAPALHHVHHTAEERRERALELAFAHMKGAHHDEVIAAARAVMAFLKDG